VLAQLLWNAAGLWPLVLVAVAAILILTFWLYPSQTRGLPKLWQVLLPAVRVLAVLALAISLLKPTLSRPRTQDEHGAIVVLIDSSASMGIADSQMSSAQRVVLADGLGLLPASKRRQDSADVLRALAELRDDLDMCSRGLADMEYARLSGKQEQRRRDALEQDFAQTRKRAAALNGMLAGAALEGELRGQLKPLEETPDEKRRLGWVKDLRLALTSLEAALQKRQAEADVAIYKADAEVRRIADATAGQTRFRLAEQAIVGDRGLLAHIPADVPVYGYTFAEKIRPLPLRSGEENVKKLIAEPDRQQSRIGESILAALEQLRGRAVRGVVVFSDGRPVGGSAVADATLVNTPVFAVQCAQTGATKDIAISSVAMPQSAYADETVNVKVGLRALGLPAGEQEIVLKTGEKQEMKKARLDAAGSGEAEFQLKVDRPGTQEIQISVKPLDGEATTQNNAITRRLKVMQGKLAVMLLGSEPSWDYQYVRNALTRTRWAKLTDVLLDDPKAQLDVDGERILQQNVIVLHGLRAAALTSQQVDALHRAVTQRGACVILVAGDLDVLDGYARNVLLGELLPYRPGERPAWRDWPGDRPAFHVVPARGDESLDALRLADDLQDSMARWNNLPAIYHYLALPQLKPNVIRSLLVEKDSQLPVLLESRLGNGRVLFFGVRESWRWRMRVAERDQDRFWLQTVRYGGEEPYALVSADLAMDIDHVSVRPGDAVRVRARVSGDTAQAPAIELLRDGKVVRTERPLAPPDAQPGRFEAVLRDLAAGDYEVAVRRAGENAGMKMPLHVGIGLDQELADVSPDDVVLQRLCEGTGGEMVQIAGCSELPAKLADLRHRYGSMAEIPLWTSGYLFLFVLACLALEWAIRKRAGLA
jgi:hypothetical protein